MDKMINVLTNIGEIKVSRRTFVTPLVELALPGGLKGFIIKVLWDILTAPKKEDNNHVQKD